MKNQSSSSSVPNGNNDRAFILLKAGWSALELHELRQIHQNELCRSLGISPGTLINWRTAETELNQIEALLRIFERLPCATREELLGRVLRRYPTIESQEFAHAPTTVSRLRQLVRRRAGITWIYGGTDTARSFLFTALAHSTRQIRPSPDLITGIDMHSSDWFVPVEGIAYVPPEETKRKLAEQASRVWPHPHHAAWIMINGVWSIVPAKHEQLLAWSREHHVVIAEETDVPEQIRKANLDVPVRLLQVSEGIGQSINVDFREV